MKTPSWQEIVIPKVVVDNLRIIKPGFTFDTLLYQIVFHNSKKLFVSYNCDQCGHIHTPTKTTDEVNHCPACLTKQVRCVQSLKFNKTSKVPMYSRKENYIEAIAGAMNLNFCNYFKQSPELNLDWEWRNNQFHVAFAGGETASDISPRVAIARAALMTPYLWDTKFDWKTFTFVDKVDKCFITGILSHLRPLENRYGIV